MLKITYYGDRQNVPAAIYNQARTAALASLTGSNKHHDPAYTQWAYSEYRHQLNRDRDTHWTPGAQAWKRATEAVEGVMRKALGEPKRDGTLIITYCTLHWA